MAKEELVHFHGVLVEFSESPAIRDVARRGYDKLLCVHVYQEFCPACGQYECKRRRV